MKILKVIIAIIFLLVLVSALVLRVKKVMDEESTSTILTGLQEGDKFVLAAYYPVTKEVVINDSTVFYPGKLLVQDVIKVKHHFFIFSSYYEKSPTNGKYLVYQSNGDPNTSNFIIQADWSDTTFNRILYDQKQEEFKLDLLLDSYDLNDTVIDVRNRKFDIDKFKEIDTLKFYIKKVHINSSDAGKHIKYELTLKQELLDSILFVKNKRFAASK